MQGAAQDGFQQMAIERFGDQLQASAEQAPSTQLSFGQATDKTPAVHGHTGPQDPRDAMPAVGCQAPRNGDLGPHSIPQVPHSLIQVFKGLNMEVIVLPQERLERVYAIGIQAPNV